LKKLLQGIAVLLCLLIAIILVGPSLINWNNYKADLINEVERLSGRQLDIKGDIEISILPAPAVIAEDVSLSNSVGASAENLLTLKSLEVRVALGPLLGGKIKVQTVRLIDPVIELQRFADGHTNVDFFFINNELKDEKPEMQIGDIELAESTEILKPNESVSRFSLDNFSIQNARLNYRDDMSGRTETIENFDATFAASSPSGPFASSGSMVVGGFPLEYTISVDKIIEERTAPISLTVSLDPGQTKTSFSGAIIGLDEVPRFEGLVKTTGKNLAELVQFANPKSSFPGLLGQEFSIDARVAASAEAADISELSISLGNAIAKGSAGLNIKGHPSANISLALDSLDLDKWLAFPAMSAAVEEVLKKEKNHTGGGGTETTTAFVMGDKVETANSGRHDLLSDFIDVTINVTAKSVAFNKGLVRQVRLSAEVSGGEITISHASANLPGNASVDLFGFVLTDKLLPRFDGKMEVSVGNLRGMMDWLDAPMPSVPADRLLRIVLSGNVEATQSKISLSKLDLQFDSSRLTGKTELSFDERLSVDADLTLDRLNLDSYLGDSQTKAVVNAKKVPQDVKKNRSKKIKLTEDQASNPLAIFKNLDANIKSKVKTLVYDGTQVKDANLKLSLRDGTINVHHLSVEKLAGSTFRAHGSLSDIEGIPMMKGVVLDAKFSDLSRFFRLFGKNIPIDREELGEINLRGKIDGPLLKPNVAFKLKGAGADIKAKGKFSMLSLDGSFKGDLKVVIGDLVRILRPLGINNHLNGKFGAFDLDSEIKIDKSGLILSDLKANLGSVPVVGTTKILLVDPRTKVDADLSTGVIAVNQHFAFSDDTLSKKPRTTFPTARPALGRSTNKTKLEDLTDFSPGRWPTNPVDLSFLENFDANIRLKSEVLAYGRYRISNSNLQATIADGILTINELNGELFGGTIKVTATAKSASPLTFESAVSLNALSMEKGLLAAIGESPASGLAGMNVKLAASGYTISDLVASLNGSGSIGLEAINVSRMGRGTTFSPVLGLLSQLNNIGGKLSGGNSSKGFANITGTFDIKRGIAQSEDLQLASTMGNGYAKGKFDLSRWLINVAGQFEFSPNFIGKMLKTGGTISTQLPFSIRGELNSPSVKLDTTKLISGEIIKKGLDSILKKKGVGGLLKNILPGMGVPNQKARSPSQLPIEQGTTSSTPAPQNQQKVPPGEILKKLIIDLGR